MTAATASITIAAGKPSAGQQITLISGDAVSKTYTAVAGSATLASNQFSIDNTNNDVATSLELAIEHASGHNGKILVSRADNVLTLTQKTPGSSGNTTITSNLANTTVVSFSGAHAPSPHSASSASSSTGRDDNIRSSVGSTVEATVLVDNGIHHAIYIRDSATTGQNLALKRFAQSDFQVTAERRYRLIEEESAVRLTYADVPGINDSTTVFFETSPLSGTATPPMLLHGESDKLRPKAVETATKGSRLTLQNMNGRSLDDLSFTDTHVHAGQLASVGLRTTDLVQRIFKDVQHSLNSISVGLPYTGSRTGSSTTNKGESHRHSTNFLAQDFRGVTIPSAVRFVGRYDHYAILHDRFGNFIYGPDVMMITDRKIGTKHGESNTQIDPVAKVANRIIVRGDAIALNDVIEAVVDDAELQKKHGSVKSITNDDPTATTVSAARRNAAQLLRLNRKGQGALSSEGNLYAWDLEPGMVVLYENPEMGEVLKQAIVEVEHNLKTGLSDLTMLSYDRGIEGIMMAFQDASAIGSSSNDRTSQRLSLEKSGVGRGDLRVRGFYMRRLVLGKLARTNTVVSNSTTYSGASDGAITLINTIPDLHSGFLIGHRGPNHGSDAGRSAVGTGLTPRTAHTGLTSTTLAVTSTTGFPSSGHLIIEESIHATYTGKTATTFTGISVRAPNGGSIGSSGSVRMLRSRSHEMRTVKSKPTRRTI